MVAAATAAAVVGFFMEKNFDRRKVHGTSS